MTSCPYGCPGYLDAYSRCDECDCAPYLVMRINGDPADCHASRIEEPEGKRTPVQRAFSHVLDLANPDIDDRMDFAVVYARDSGAARVKSWAPRQVWHQTVRSAVVAPR